MKSLLSLGSLLLCLGAAQLSAQTEGAEDIPLDTPLDEIVCGSTSDTGPCWRLGGQLLDVDPARAGAVFQKACAEEPGILGCYEAGKLYLLNKRVVNYDLAYEMFEAACYRIEDRTFGPYGCKYLGHMVQLGLGRPSDVQEGHWILARACITHNEGFADEEGCELLAKSYLFGFDIKEKGRSPNALPLAFIAYARGCVAGAAGLCSAGNAFMQANRRDAGLTEFLGECDADLAAMEKEERTCREVFDRPRFLPRGYAGARASAFEKSFIQFWRVQFARLEPDANL